MAGWFDEGRLGALMEQAGVDAVLTTAQVHIGYLTGFESPFIPQRHEVAAAVFTPGQPPALVVPNHEILRAYDTGIRDIDLQPYGSYHFYDRATAPDPLYEYYTEQLKGRQDDFVSAIDSALRQRHPASKRVAFDDFGLTQRSRGSVESSLSRLGWRLEPGTALLQRARMVKTSREIAALEQATEITERGFAAVISALRPGITELDLLAIFRGTVLKEGAELGHWLTTMGADRAWTVLGPSTRALRSDDLIRADGGVRFNGYVTDVGCVIALGRRAAEVAEVHRRLEAGLTAAREAARPGARISEIFTAGVNAVVRAGMPDYKRGNVGHGIGREAYELPIIRPSGQRDLLFDADDDDFTVEVGMILNLEMPYMVHGFGGFIVERMFVVETGGVRQLGRMDTPMRVIN